MYLSKRNQGFTLIELMVVMAIISILTALLVTGISHAIFAGNRTDCASNIRNIGIAIQGYQNAFRGMFPGQDYSKPFDSSGNILEYLYDAGKTGTKTGLLTDERILSCAHSPVVVNDITAIGADGSYLQRDLNGHPLNRRDSDPTRAPILADKGANHEGKGANILFLTGNVEWVSSVEIGVDLEAHDESYSFKGVTLQLPAGS